MAVFFMLVGLEIKREVLPVRCRRCNKAALPAVAALGGVLAPAAIYVAISAGNADALAGWAMPVATDIAFALGVLALVGPRAPSSLKVFLTALAVLDDLLAVLIIVLFYTADGFGAVPAVRGIGWRMLIGMNRLGVSLVRALSADRRDRLVLRAAVRVHPTLAGVLVAFTIPIDGDARGRSRITAASVWRRAASVGGVGGRAGVRLCQCRCFVQRDIVGHGQLARSVSASLRVCSWANSIGILSSAWIATRLGSHVRPRVRRSVTSMV